MKDMKLYTGAESLYQWDQDQKLILEGELAVCRHVHFYDVDAKCAAVLETRQEEDLTVCDIPNHLLQLASPVRCWVWLDTEKRTFFEKAFPVIARQEPCGYVYTPTDIVSWESLMRRMDAIEIKDAEQDGAISALDLNIQAVDGRVTSANERMDGIEREMEDIRVGDPILMLQASDSLFRIDAKGTPIPGQSITLRAVTNDIAIPVRWTLPGRQISDGTRELTLTPADIPQDRVGLSNIMRVDTTGWMSHPYSEVIESDIRLQGGHTYYVTGRARLSQWVEYKGTLHVLRLMGRNGDTLASYQVPQPSVYVEYTGFLLYTPPEDMTVSLESEMNTHRMYPENGDCMIVDVTQLMGYPALAEKPQQEQIKILAGYIDYMPAGGSTEVSLAVSDRLPVVVQAGAHQDMMTIGVVFESLSIIRALTDLKGRLAVDAGMLKDHGVKLAEHSALLDQHTQALAWAPDPIIDTKMAARIEAPTSEHPVIGLRILGRTSQPRTKGLNMLDLRDVSSPSGVSAVTNPDGSITFSGRPTSNNATFENIYLNNYLRNGRTYTLWQERNDRKVYSLVRIQDGVITDITSDAKNPTFTFDSSKQYFYYLQTGTVQETGDLQEHTNRFMIYEGRGPAPEFEPYTGGMPSPNSIFPHALDSVGAKGQVLTTLGRSELRSATPQPLEGMDGIYDTLDYGTGNDERYFRRRRLLSSDEWTLTPCTSGGDEMLFTLRIADLKPTPFGIPHIRCTHMSPVEYATILNHGGVDSISVSPDEALILISMRDNLNQLTAFRSFLESNVVEIAYERAELSVTDLPRDEMDAFRKIRLEYPSTLAYTDEQSEIELTYKADTKGYIDEQIALLKKR